MIPESHKPAYRLMAALSAFIILWWSGAIFVALLVREINESGQRSKYNKSQSNGTESTITLPLAQYEKKTSGNDADYISSKEFLAGVFAVITFAVSYFALKAASRNADAAKEAAIANKDAVSSAKETAQIQLRPWLSVIVVEMAPPNPKWMIRYRFAPINQGSTPAVRFSFRGYTCCVPWSDIWGNELPQIEERHTWNENRMEIFPQKGDAPQYIQNCDTDMFLTPFGASDIANGNCAIVTALELRYEDVFGATHFMEMKMILIFQGPDDKGVLRIPNVTYVPGASRMWTKAKT